MKPFHIIQNQFQKSLTQCPNDFQLSNYSPFYSEDKPYECLTKCPDEFPFYKLSANDLEIYICKENTFCSEPLKYFLNGYSANINDCYSVEHFFIIIDNICLKKFKEGEIKQKNLDENVFHDHTYTCKKSCGELYIYFENEIEEPECINHCQIDKHFIGKNNICKKSCTNEDGINYYEKTVNDTDLGYSIYKCIPGCNEEYNLKQSRENSLHCYEKSPSNYPYKSKEEIICYDHCINSPNNKFTLIREDEDGIEYSRECSDKCDNPNDSNPNKRIYYGDDKVCQKNY